MTMTGLSPDTTAAAASMQFRRWREMTAEEKLAQVAALSALVMALERTGIRQRHPDADEDEVDWRVAVRRFGPWVAGRIHDRRATDA